MATTVLRLKRKRKEEPSDTLVIASKNQRETNDVNQAHKKDVFKLAGTIRSKDASEFKKVIEQYQSQGASAQDTLISNKPPRVSHAPPAAKKKCYSLVKHNSTLDSPQAATGGSSVQVYDAVINDEQWSAGADSIQSTNGGTLLPVDTNREANRVTPPSEPMELSKDEDEFVYDIFCLDSDSTLFDEELLENVLCIEAYGENYAPFRDYRCDGLYDKDDDDSNDEDNWRNDYPDEDYRSSGDEGDEEPNDYGLDAVRFDQVRLASAESEVSSSDGDEEVKFTGNKEFERYYKSYMKSVRKGKAVGECNTSEEERDSESDCNDDLF